MSCTSVLKSAGIILSEDELRDFGKPEIRSRFRKWALRNHPDKAPGNEDVFAKVRGCYEEVGRGGGREPEPEVRHRRPEHGEHGARRPPAFDDDDDSLVREFMRRYGGGGEPKSRRTRGFRTRESYPYDDDEPPRTSRYSTSTSRRPSQAKRTKNEHVCTCRTSTGRACKIRPSKGSTCHVHRRTGCSRISTGRSRPPW